MRGAPTTSSAERATNGDFADLLWNCASTEGRSICRDVIPLLAQVQPPPERNRTNHVRITMKLSAVDEILVLVVQVA
jgi:hypothetical protein